ncbi:MAG: bifunctional oligoribonuclease/PAP phosphatase NrnA [Deferribacteres bacterium]|nr:bifunctional oligoribonuclease/PAP phosphatase NrnA [Deferribacteres bacterium]
MKERIAKILDGAKSIACFFHKNPDGDAVGSALAVKNFYGDKVTVYSPSKVPEVYEFLPGVEEIVVYPDFSEVAPSEVFLVLDCADERRVPSFDKSRADVVVNIDHHETNTLFGDVNLVEADRASTSEIVFDVLKLAKGGSITREVAECVYTGLYTDTGGFKFSNTSKQAFEVAAELVDLGVEPSKIATYVYESYPFRRMRLLALSLATLELHLGGRVSSMYVTRKMFEETSSYPEDTEDFVNYTRSIKGVEVGIFLRELSGGGVKVSLRSKSQVNVAEIASSFGGGGHFNAAGCEMDCSVEEAKHLLIEAVSRVLA